MASQPKHPVDTVPPAPKLAALGVQHVLAFYAGAVIVPMLIAGSLNLDAETTIHLINADLLTCGIATIIQSMGCLLYTSPSPRDQRGSRMPSSA